MRDSVVRGATVKHMGEGAMQPAFAGHIVVAAAIPQLVAMRQHACYPRTGGLDNMLPHRLRVARRHLAMPVNNGCCGYPSYSLAKLLYGGIRIDLQSRLVSERQFEFVGDLRPEFPQEIE